MNDADGVIEALRTGHDSLVAWTDGLDEDALIAQSGASGWTVAQVLSHLGSGAEVTLAAVEDAVQGPAGTSEAEPRHTIWERWNSMAPREQADSFPPAQEALVQRYEALSESERETLLIDLGFPGGPMGVAPAARLRLGELTHHTWDARVPFEPGWVLPHDAVVALLHGAPDLTEMVGNAKAWDSRSARVRVFTEDPESSFALVVSDSVRLDHEPSGDFDAAIHLPAEAWLRLVAGRLPSTHTPSTVFVSGLVDLDQLRQLFPGY